MPWAVLPLFVVPIYVQVSEIPNMNMQWKIISLANGHQLSNFDTDISRRSLMQIFLPDVGPLKYFRCSVLASCVFHTSAATEKSTCRYGAHLSHSVKFCVSVWLTRRRVKFLFRRWLAARATYTMHLWKVQKHKYTLKIQYEYSIAFPPDARKDYRLRDRKCQLVPQE